jgi:hypothetical protein
MAKRTGSRRYGPKASEKVEEKMHEMKRGELRSGRSNARVKNPKQAIAIGLSEARREGAKVPQRKAAGGTRKNSRRSGAAKSTRSRTTSGARKTTGTGKTSGASRPAARTGSSGPSTRTSKKR